MSFLPVQCVEANLRKRTRNGQIAKTPSLKQPPINQNHCGKVRRQQRKTVALYRDRIRGNKQFGLLTCVRKHLLELNEFGT